MSQEDLWNMARGAHKCRKANHFKKYADSQNMHHQDMQHMHYKNHLKVRNTAGRANTGVTTGR